MLTLEYAYSHGFSIQEARRLTDDEKSHYLPEYHDFILIGTGDHVDLPALRWDDPFVSQILRRPEDGQFNGCANTARIITTEEQAQLIRLNDEKLAAKRSEEREAEIANLWTIISACEHSRLYNTAEEAAAARKQYNDTQNEGGDGYVPHFWTMAEYETAKRRLAELEADV